ncbi:MAG: rRNA pseudouridine synthase [Betaproteobacteria bacterium AqS2]|uniref:Pseudouridine synthase n=1 Tax=Candidatus Amphirhobacter heronislandensis TaxID=1732024 RepID=A0A930XXF9_9GAMM|nr:rRNA pseudouridine synthase [Betaproteobacteria bacterium AqS2]
MPGPRAGRPRPQGAAATVKVHKLIAMSGRCSRREAEEMVAAGRVALAGKTLAVGARVPPNARLTVDGEPLGKPADKVLLLCYHKPRGQIVSSRGPDTVFEGLPPLPRGRWISIGRLDVETEGLLLFTNDGGLANRMAHPRFGLEREYLVKSAKRLDEELLRRAVKDGVAVDGGRVKPKRFALRPAGKGAGSWYELVLDEGRNRVVRRVFAALDAPVGRLLRIRFGRYALPRGLAAGAWEYLPAPGAAAAKPA